MKAQQKYLLQVVIIIITTTRYTDNMELKAMTNTLLLRVIFSIAITASVFESIILVVYTDESSMKDFVLWSVCAVGDVIGVPLASAEVGTLFFVAVDIVSIGEV